MKVLKDEIYFQMNDAAWVQLYNQVQNDVRVKVVVNLLRPLENRTPFRQIYVQIQNHIESHL